MSHPSLNLPELRPSRPSSVDFKLPEMAPPGPSRTPLPPQRLELGAAEPPPWPERGAVLGRYRLRERIGRGTSGVVYKAEHLKLPLLVAVKVLRLERGADRQPLLEQLESEACLLALLNHPHVVRILDFDDDGPFPYLATEYVNGCALSQLIRRYGKLSQDGALQVLLRLADALTAAQQLGVVHRDIKPDNILLTSQGDVKLADLGLAVVIGDRILQGVSSSQGQAAMTGTAAYLAPEQALNPHAVDHRADIYGLGATFYHALCGRLPFEGRSCMEVVYKHLRQPPTPPVQLAPELDPEFSELLLRMLAKDPAERISSYAELQAVVRSIRARRRQRAAAADMARA